jgi:uncharacterized membrane protein
MACDPEILKQVPLFALLDEDELAVLSAEVEIRSFALGQRIFKMGDPSGPAYVVVSGAVRLTTIDEDQQEVVVDEPHAGEFFGFASMLDETAHQTSASATEPTACIEVDRRDIGILLERKPMAGLDMMTVLSRQFHASQQLVRIRSNRNPNEVIEERATPGERLADAVARFGGSWVFIIMFASFMSVYAALNVFLGKSAWDPYPFILLNLFLSMLAAVQAPVIMMSQNRQDAKDRLRSELDFDVNRRAASDIQGLARKLNVLDDKVDDLLDALRNNTPPAGSRRVP